MSTGLDLNADVRGGVGAWTRGQDEAPFPILLSALAVEGPVHTLNSSICEFKLDHPLCIPRMHGDHSSAVQIARIVPDALNAESDERGACPVHDPLPPEVPT